MATCTTEKAISANQAGSPVSPQLSKRTRSRRLQKITTFTTYATAVALIASVVSVGYESPIERQVAAQTSDTMAIQLANPSVDQLQAAELAASAAQLSNLSVATNVTNLSISLGAKSELAQTSDTVLSKPQIVQSGTDRRGISEYTTIAGDTVQSVAEKYGVSVQTVKWVNRLVSDALTPGTKLSIPGVDGVIHTVASGDSVDSIASKYTADKSRIITYNDIELGGVQPGQKLVIPAGILPESDRPEAIQRAQLAYSGIATTRATSAPQQTYTNATIAGNRYDYGYCTWYAYNRRAELGRPVGSFWGNAATWASFARGSGYVVNGTPAVGAVMQDSYSAGGYGHVAVVESINGDGSITVSEMNYNGWNVYSRRTLDAGQAARYNYIH